MSQTLRPRPHEIPWPTLSRDTDPGAEAVQLEIYRRMTAEEKIQLVWQANEESRVLALAGLRLRYPTAGKEELQRRLKGLLLGEELATKVYGPVGQARKDSE